MCFLEQICAQADKEIRNKELKIANVHKLSYRQDTPWKAELDSSTAWPKVSQWLRRTNITAGSDSPFNPVLDN